MKDRHQVGIILYDDEMTNPNEKSLSNALAEFELGKELYSQGLLTEAEAAYRRALAIDPNYAEAENDLGNVLVDQDRSEEAIGAYRRAIKAEPDFAEAMKNLGITLHSQGRLKEASQAYRQTLAIQASDTEGENDPSELLDLLNRVYRGYVGPIDHYDLMAASQFNLLTTLGLRQDHKILDIGCGSLRAGKLFIPYLEPGNYHGVEPERWLVEEGISNQVGKDLIEIKKPEFLYVRDWSFPSFEVNFDYIIAQSVFSHAPGAEIRSCLFEAERCMGAESIFAANFLVGRTDHSGKDWSYPDMISYTRRTINELVHDAGFVSVEIEWEHPILTWFLIVKPGNRQLLANIRKKVRIVGPAARMRRRLVARGRGSIGKLVRKVWSR